MRSTISNKPSYPLSQIEHNSLSLALLSHCKSIIDFKILICLNSNRIHVSLTQQDSPICYAHRHDQFLELLNHSIRDSRMFVYKTNITLYAKGKRNSKSINERKG